MGFNGIFHGISWDFMGFNGIYPLVNIQKAFENGRHRNDLPMKNGDFPLCELLVYQRGSTKT